MAFIVFWNRFNNALSRAEDAFYPVNMYVFGTPIDTIITTLTYMQRSMVDMGMMKGHLCMDLQLYVLRKLVCCELELA